MRKTSQDTGTGTNTQRAEDQAVGGTDLVDCFTELCSLINFQVAAPALPRCILTNQSAFGK